RIASRVQLPHRVMNDKLNNESAFGARPAGQLRSVHYLLQSLCSLAGRAAPAILPNDRPRSLYRAYENGPDSPSNSYALLSTLMASTRFTSRDSMVEGKVLWTIKVNLPLRRVPNPCSVWAGTVPPTHSFRIKPA